uniref:UDP-glucuronosyltransferase n=1 Tax=Lygus hesperus TaxID=30085 RepID=A0A146LV96_LYGHE
MSLLRSGTDLEMRLIWMAMLVLVTASTQHVHKPARILAVVPMPWKSHHFVFQTIIKALAARGHQIDYLTPFPIENAPPNVRHLMIKDTFAETIGSVELEDMDLFWSPQEHLMWRSMNVKYLEEVYRNEPAIRTLLSSNEQYAIVMSECNINQEITAVWAHRFNATPVSVLAVPDMFFANEMTGLPGNPSYMLDSTSHLSDRMDFLERLWNSVQYVVSLPLHYYKLREFQRVADEVLRYPGWETRPSVSRLASDQALVLVNSHVSVGSVYPRSPHVKEIGGMTLTGSTLLPKDLQSFMDSAAEGVVYFSLGSSVDMNVMTRGNKMDGFLRAFQALKHRVVLKWMGDNMPNISDPRILIRTWFPQLGILAHKNTRVFVTHGGLQSLMETVNYGVPVVAIPIFGDQFKNVKIAVSRGLGIELAKQNLTETSLRWAIEEVAKNTKYKEAVRKRSNILKDVPMKHVDEAVYWIEYVLRHGRVLQPASLHMPFYQIYLLDVAAFIIAVLGVFYFLIKAAKANYCR